MLDLGMDKNRRATGHLENNQVVYDSLKCTKCKVFKAPGEFSTDNRRWSSKKAWCKACDQVRDAARVKVRYESNRVVIRRAKNVACLDCSNQYPYYVMDFDHVRGEKLFNLSAVTGWHTAHQVAEELAKCDLVCSNCHRIRTHNGERGYKQAHPNKKD